MRRTTAWATRPGLVGRPDEPADSPDRPLRAGTAGNARLTALTGLLLLGLFATQVVTLFLGVQSVLTAHVVIGSLLTPPALVKVGSSAWRIVRYYRGDPGYRSRGAPPTVLRILGPILVGLTVTLLGSGVLAYLGPRALHDPALQAHQVSFYAWLVALLGHVVPHFLEAVQLAAADLLGRTGIRVPGAAARRAILVAALAAGAVAGVAVSGHAGTYLGVFAGQ